MPFGAQVSFELDQAGVQFKSFEYKGTMYPKLWAKDVLEQSLDVKNTIISAGRKLNNLVGVNCM